MPTSWTNPDGLVLYYGTRDVENERTRVVNAPGPWVTVIVDFDENTLPSSTASDTGQVKIPANSFIKEAHVQVRTAAGGTTPTLTLGLEELDGTAIDADGIDAAIAESAMNSVGEVVICNGALVAGLTGIGSADGYVVATMGGTNPTGAFRLVLTYLPPVSFDSFSD